MSSELASCERRRAGEPASPELARREGHVLLDDDVSHSRTEPPLRVLTLLALVFVALIAASCADFGKSVRAVTYPPDFHYIPKDHLDSAMWQMAAAVQDLDSTLRNDALGEPAKQERVLALLDQLRATSGHLGGGARSSNHPLLDRNVPRLTADIEAARLAASASPPRYALAGAVSGACIYCHSAPPVPE